MLHEPFCIRTVKKCSLCNEVINIDDEEDHMKENHREITCKFCHRKFPQNLIELHSLNCEEQPAECKFCSLHIILREKKEHEYICGAKTEYCQNCRKFIPIKDYEAHSVTSCYPEETYLHHHIDVNNIPVITKYKKPRGSIRDAAKFGLLNDNKKSNDEKTIEIKERDIHKELGHKIEELNRNKKDTKEKTEEIKITEEKRILHKISQDQKHTQRVEIPANLHDKININPLPHQEKKHAVIHSEEANSKRSPENIQTSIPSSTTQNINSKEFEINVHSNKNHKEMHDKNLKEKQKLVKHDITSNEKIIHNPSEEIKSIKPANKITLNNLKNKHLAPQNNSGKHEGSEIKAPNLNNKEHTIPGNVAQIVNSKSVKVEIPSSKNTHRIKTNLNAAKNFNTNNQALVKNFPYKKQIPENQNQKEIITQINKHNDNPALQEIKLPHTENQVLKNENLINVNSNRIPLKNTNLNIENRKEDNHIPLTKTSNKKIEENKNQPIFMNKNKKKNVKKTESKNLKNIDINNLNDYYIDEDDHDVNSNLDYHSLKHDFKDKKKINIEDEVLMKVLELSKKQK